MGEKEDKENASSQQTAETKFKSKGKRQRYKKKKGKKHGTKGKGSQHNATSKFVGGEPGMRGHVFQCREESKSTLQYQNTCKELIRFVSSTYTQHEDIVNLIETMEAPDIPEPPSPKMTIIKD